MSNKLAIYLSIVSLPVMGWSVDFAHEVMPILKRHCTECHTGGQKKGGLAMNTRAEFVAGGEYGEVVVPGHSGDSLFLELIESDDDSEWMPPKGPRLTEEEVDVLKRWVDQGMVWPESISLGEKTWEPPLAPRQVELPPITDGRSHPIDRILDAELQKAGQSYPETIGDAAYLRRATLDAVGMLPTPEILEAFDNDREAYVQTLLADDIAYADHWLTFWNDLLRNDYTGTGFITKGRTQITDWLYTALRSNMAYDEFVKQLIAPPDDRSAGFINGIKWRGEVNASQTREIQFSQNISQVFLGINMKCASCHDSFIDSWKLEEAYNLAAIFSEQPLELNRCDKPTGVMAEPKWIFPEMGDIDADAPKAERLKQLADLMTHADNGRFTRTVVNRIWDRLMGRGIVHPVDAMDTKPWNEDLLDYLAVRFAEDGYDLRKFIAFVMASQAYQSQSVILEKEPGESYRYSGSITKRMTAEQLIDAVWQITGTHPTQADGKVNRVVTETADQSEERLITPADVTAKWLWHVGEPGTKSELKRTIKLDSQPKAAMVMATCDNAFKLRINGQRVAESSEWQKPRYVNVVNYLKAGANEISVDAEMHGGAFGFICELVVVGADGKQVSFGSNRNWDARPPGGEWAKARELHKHGKGPWKDVLKPYEAMLPQGYTPPIRASLVKNDFLMRSLGRPHRDQVVTSRPAELSTLQAIDLANGEIFAGHLTAGAQQLIRDGRVNTDFGKWLFQYAYSRVPTTEEERVIAEVLGNGEDPLAVEDLLWLVVMQPEFQLVR